MIGHRLVIVGVGLALSLGGCSGSTAPSASARVPASSGPSGARADAWEQVAIALPVEVTGTMSLEPGYFCDPCHAPNANMLLGVGASAGGIIAVGVQEPPAQAIAFVSADGRQWEPLPGFEGSDGSTATAATTNGSRSVIVGFDHSGATAWASAGGTWTEAPPQADLLVPYVAGGMTSVAPFERGFVAGGYRDDPAHAARSAAVWRSSDGLTWSADDAAGAFEGGRILAIATKAGTVVAVGTSGDPTYGPAGAWRWTAADGWRRARIGPDAGGAMRGVATTASGFIAVGLNGTDTGARAWTSPDGLTWTAAPDQPAFHYAALPVRMQSVMVTPTGIVAAGWRSDQGKGSALVWTSADGVTWDAPQWESSFSGADIAGLILSGGRVVAVGTMGYPDNDRATAWVSRADGPGAGTAP